jgi:hypothetical protein
MPLRKLMTPSSLPAKGMSTNVKSRGRLLVLMLVEPLLLELLFSICERSAGTSNFYLATPPIPRMDGTLTYLVADPASDVPLGAAR